MAKKPIMHYEIPKTIDAACGIDWFWNDIRQTSNWRKVTCKRCKQTWLWKKEVRK